jgi:hypothetical protein
MGRGEGGEREMDENPLEGSAPGEKYGKKTKKNS